MIPSSQRTYNFDMTFIAYDIPLLLAQSSSSSSSASGSSLSSGDSQMIIWGIVLIGAAVLLFFLEVFVPSGGLIGLVSGVCLVAGIILIGLVNQTAGAIVAVIALLSVPPLILFAMKILPDTPFWKWLSLSDYQPRLMRDETLVPERAEDAYDEAYDEVIMHPAADASTLKVGMTGEAAVDLRPIGVCVINGERIECLSTHGIIPKHSQVRVVEVDGMQVKVKQVQE